MIWSLIINQWKLIYPAFEYSILNNVLLARKIRVLRKFSRLPRSRNCTRCPTIPFHQNVKFNRASSKFYINDFFVIISILNFCICPFGSHVEILYALYNCNTLFQRVTVSISRRMVSDGTNLCGKREIFDVHGILCFPINSWYKVGGPNLAFHPRFCANFRDENQVSPQSIPWGTKFTNYWPIWTYIRCSIFYYKSLFLSFLGYSST